MTHRQPTRHAPSHPPVTRRPAQALALALVMLAAPVGLLMAQTATPAALAKPAAAKPGAKATVKPGSSRQKLNSEAKGLALATATAETISQVQLEIADRVLTGSADCEFNQQVSVLPLQGQPGMFSVTHKGQRYRMVPQETATGAVRLEDKAAGVVWLQIPVKSMLMNARAGQRMVDSCLHSEQRAALAAVAGAAQNNGIGIVPQAAPPAAATLANTPLGAPATSVAPAASAPQ